MEDTVICCVCGEEVIEPLPIEGQGLGCDECREATTPSLLLRNLVSK